MPRANLTPVAEEDLFALDERAYEQALKAMAHLELYPDSGHPVPALQLEIDAELRAGLHLFQWRIAPGIRLFIYYEVDEPRDILVVEHIKQVVVL